MNIAKSHIWVNGVSYNQLDKLYYKYYYNLAGLS